MAAREAARTRGGFTAIDTYAQHEDVTHSRASAEGVLSAGGLKAWRHAASRVRVVRFASPGPIVSLTVFVGTEPISDAGHPHTLEHIIFLGSKLHPERGYLDTLACRSLGEGTNAHTANEYTCYTATTAGVEGFVSLLPCYLDHVLSPTRTADVAAFSSEVFHQRADGKDAGVVMSEMLAREHTEVDIGDRELRIALLGGTPLAFEAGGMCAAIRTLTPADVHEYHQRFYCGANVSIVVGGSALIPDDVLLDAVAPLLDAYASQPGFRPGKPAWQSPLALTPLPVAVDKRMVPFPCVDASMGSVLLGWRAPSCRAAYNTLAIDVLLQWLCGFETSPLTQQFVMIETPLASDVHHELETYLEISTVSLVLEGVEHAGDEDEGGDDEGPDDVKDDDVHSVDEGAEGGEEEETDFDPGTCEDSLLASGRVGGIVVDFLGSIVKSRELPGGLKSVRAAVDRHKEEYLADIESDAHNVVPNAMVEELIYDDRMAVPIGTAVRGYLGLLARLEEEGADFWLNLIETVLVNAPRVEIYMIPDPALAERLASDAQSEVEARLASCSPAARREMQTRADESMASLSPVDFADSSLPPLPTTERIPRIPYHVTSSPPGPFFSQLVAVDSGLVHATIVFSTSGLSFEQRACLTVLSDMLLSMDVLLDDGRRLPYAESSRAISEATVGTDRSGVWLGRLARMNCAGIGVNYSATVDKFEDATAAVLRAIFNGQPTGARLSSVAKNLDSDVVECMRDAQTLRAALSTVLPRLASGECGKNAVSDGELGSLFGRAPLLEFIADEYSRDSGRLRVRRKLLQLLTSSLAAIRAQPASKVFVQIGARDPRAAMGILDARWSHCWRPEASAAAAPGEVGPVQMPPCILFQPHPTLAELGGTGREVARALGVPGSDTCYLEVCVDCMVPRGHADWASLQVLTEMLSRTEGPLYSAVRGAGLAYGVGLGHNYWQSKLVITVSEASLPAEAWSAVCAKLRDFRRRLVDGEADSWLQSELNTAKSTLLYGMVEGCSTPSNVVAAALTSCVVGVPPGQLADRTNEEAVEMVDTAAMRDVFDKYAAHLLQPSARLATMACNPKKVAATVDAFRSCPQPILFETMDVDDCFLPPVNDMVAQLAKTK
jgi:Zn-dependent M16 (insulinase) family peptidase